MLNHSSSELHDIWSPFCVVLQHKINLSFLLDWLFLLCSKHNASSNFAKHLVRHISPSPFSSNDNRGKHIDGLFSFRMTHKPHLAYRAIKYCPALLKFMVHLLQNPCIKITQPCQGNHFDVITFRNYSVRFFMSGLCVQSEKGPFVLIPQIYSGVVLFRFLISTDPQQTGSHLSCAFLCRTARGNTIF